jgi:hypothetical protein
MNTENHSANSDLAGSALAKDRYRVSIDAVDSVRWHQILGLFDDACIHQTWTFGASIWGDQRVSHLLLYDNDRIVAAAQVITVTIPPISAGIAHCKFGPMWRLRGESHCPEVYQAVLAAMREEYAGRRGLLLRVKPWETGGPEGGLADQRSKAGLQPQLRLTSYDTFVLDLSRNMEELRARFKPKWRYNLKKAEKRTIETVKSSNATAAAEFMTLYDQMRDIKTFVDTSEVDLLPQLMADLPESLRPMVFTAHVDLRPVASIVVSLIGDVGYYLFGASGAVGRETGASYVLFWQAIGWLKDNGCKSFDLVGSRPQGTGGEEGYRRFKSGLTGRNGNEESMQDWEVCDRLLSRVLVQGGTQLRWYSRKSRHLVNGIGERCKRLLKRSPK